MSFQFRLESLLKYRRHQLDQCRQLMADVLRDQETCTASLQDLDDDRTETLEQMRTASLSGSINVRKLASIRYDVAQIDEHKLRLRADHSRYEKQLELCRQAVQQADAAVKSLERLRDKQLQQHDHKEARKTEISLQDAWASVNLRAT
ncbi:flagellar FliJ family protein [Rubinisphaera margarita]|uniref:flagellar FliJ family protein n=1 Tax=Rubinisphaera margarita TaxID=2909586 RepID=UPI001EE94C43|nr:flagellar FliJ family protein [Rubinisphaera margarita]MCG6154508.1 flagellar FliJ family protein [Rubinisphaera margarita]